MPVPNLILGGAQKSATTTLSKLLGEHPDICPGVCKEPQFYTLDNLFLDRGLSYFDEFYSDYRGEKYLLDASTSYMSVPYVPQRIHDTLGTQVKFIFSIRHPIDRVVSAYKHRRQKGNGLEERTLQDIVPALRNLALDELLHDEAEETKRRFLERQDFVLLPDMAYFNVSCYSKHILRYFRHFPRENFLFLTFEEVTQHSHVVLEKISRFLEIDRAGFPKEAEIHSNRSFAYKNRFTQFVMHTFGRALETVLPSRQFRSLQTSAQKLFTNPVSEKFSDDLYRDLMRLFEPEIKRTQDLTGLNLSHWLR